MSGVLNECYLKALNGRFCSWKKVRINQVWGTSIRDELKDRHGTVFTSLLSGDSSTRSMSCCGMSEFNFQAISTTECKRLSEKNFEQVIAKYIARGLVRDNRIYVVGLPIGKSVKRATSYDFVFYNRLLKTLESFGFKRINKEPYVNKNSKNYIVALSAQKE